MATPQDRDIWDARTYGQYTGERSRPFHDLLARIDANDPRIMVDLGCGSGSGLSTMSRRWPRAQLIGVDSSADMLDAARAELGAVASVRLIQAEARTWSPEEPIDVLVCNAALQWIPDHPDVLPEIASWLAPQGWLAVQVPGNFEAPSHVLLRQLAGSPQWRGRLDGIQRGPGSVLDATGYFRILADAGLIVDAWETTYLHVLTGLDPVLAWTSGTALRPVLAVLSEADAAEFSGQYAELLRAAYPADHAGRVLFPFRRVFAVAHRS